MVYLNYENFINSINIYVLLVRFK